LGVPFAKANVRLSALAFFAENHKKALKHSPVLERRWSAQSLTRIQLKWITGSILRNVP